jgi:hypothetical protein
MAMNFLRCGALITVMLATIGFLGADASMLTKIGRGGYSAKEGVALYRQTDLVGVGIGIGVAVAIAIGFWRGSR